MKDCKELLKLKRRAERLLKFIEMDAPKIIMDNEIRLIESGCEEYLDKYCRNSTKSDFTYLTYSDGTVSYTQAIENFDYKFPEFQSYYVFDDRNSLRK